LISRLPRYLPSGQYHGDLTMDNCLHGIDGKFYLIDPLTTDYDGWAFDLAKLMQDLVCGWFIRDKDVMLHGKLWSIRSAIVNKYPAAGDPNLLILMLLRVLPYAKTIEDQGFLIKEINKLWTL
jgi:fructosamine-3-kinase